MKIIYYLFNFVMFSGLFQVPINTTIILSMHNFSLGKFVVYLYQQNTAYIGLKQVRTQAYADCRLDKMKKQSSSRILMTIIHFLLAVYITMKLYETEYRVL